MAVARAHAVRSALAMLLSLLAGAATGACELGAPPGPSVDDPPPPASLPLPTAASSAAPAVNPEGQRIASIAMRTWVYAQPDDRSTRLGYLRAGAVVGRAAQGAGTQGCAGGWYAIEPRGHVCVGKGASLDLKHPVVVAALRGPRRGQPLPYPYVVSRQPPPHLYFRLPSEEQQQQSEGKSRIHSAYGFTAADRARLEPIDEIPRFLLDGGTLPKPYGAERSLHYAAHRGRAKLDSAFGLIAVFSWTDRLWGLTTELDLLPVDRTRVARGSAVDGVVVPGKGTPAFVVHHGVPLYEPDDGGRLRETAKAAHRSGWVLTGKHNGLATGLVETTAGPWLPAGSLTIAKVREDPAGFARQGRKWIDVSISQQLLVAYEGQQPAYATLVSTGRGGMGDPDKSHSTVRGTFMIHAKHITATMDGDEATDEAYDLRDVPYVQYFHKGYALHGAYWHDKFGAMRSHGCINLPPAAAAWLFEWTHPVVSKGWHGAHNPNAGTLIRIHR